MANPYALLAVTVLVLSLSQLAQAASHSSSDTPVPANRFYTLLPCRALDTRDLLGPTGGQPLVGGVTRTFALAGRCRIPWVASAISANVTVVGPTLAGNLSAYAADIPAPATSVLNFNAGQVRGNNVLLSVAQDLAATLAVRPDMAGGTVHLILDVNGYYAPTGNWPPVE